MSKTAILVSTLTLLAVLAVSFQAGVDSVPACFESICPDPEPTVYAENYDEYFDDDAGAPECPEPVVCSPVMPNEDVLCVDFCKKHGGYSRFEGVSGSNCFCVHEDYEFDVTVTRLRALYRTKHEGFYGTSK